MTTEQKKGLSAKYRIENIVVSVNFNVPIDLKKISEKFKDAEFNLNKFPGICIRIKSPRSAILLFSNGKMIITGLRQTKYAFEVIALVIERVKQVDIVLPPNPPMRIVNLVVSMNFQQKINLDQASLLLEHTVYEPEVFPGLIFRNEEPIKCVFLIFSSGKVVVTGLKKESDIIPAIKFLGRHLREIGVFKTTENLANI